jgi:NtrC-family two-component system sensor histidine kinase KinB
MFALNKLSAKFILAGGILVAISLITSIWSAFTFFQLSSMVSQTVQKNQTLIDLIAELSGCLEREDDALLRSLSTDLNTVRELVSSEREKGDIHLIQVNRLLETYWGTTDNLFQPLEQAIREYRTAGDSLLENPDETRLLFYNERVNEKLRMAVIECQKIREALFQLLKDSALQTGFRAKRGTWIVFGLAGSSLLLGSTVMWWLAQSILNPVRNLTRSVDAIRNQQLDQRIEVTTSDELGELAVGFNRMADSLTEYRESSLGELLTAKHTLESTLNALPDAVAVINPDGELAAANPPAIEVLGKLGCQIGSLCSELRIPEKHLQQIQTALQGKKPVVSRSDFHQTLDLEIHGRRRKFILTAMPIREFFRGRYGAVMILDDVTEFARLDELRSELIGVASHELKSPLTTLRMNLMMLMEEGQELRSQHYQLLSAAVDGLEELGFTVDELLDVSRIEAGQLQLQLAPINLGVVLNQAIQGLITRFDDGQVDLNVIGPIDSLNFLGDPLRITIVLVNLLSNALKYSPPGSTVTLKAMSRQNALATGQNALQIEVIDQGRGVPGAFRERIFDKFFRVEHELPSHQAQVRGTGIGLYLCREILQAHGGSIQCESNGENRGTRILLRLPLIEAI